MKGIWAGLILAILLLFGAGGWFTHYATAPSHVEQESVVLIPRGVGVREITAILAEYNLIENDLRFPALARITGTASRLRAGESLLRR